MGAHPMVTPPFNRYFSPRHSLQVAPRNYEFSFLTDEPIDV